MAETIRERLDRERAQRERQQAEQRAGMAAIRPTPTAHECNAFITAVASNALPHSVSHQQDGSAIDPHSFDPSPITSPTWPEPT